MAIAPRPRRKQGVRKAISSSGFGLRDSGFASGFDSGFGIRDSGFASGSGSGFGIRDWGFASETASTDPHEPLAAGEIAEERAVQGFRRVQHGVIDPVFRELGGQRQDVRL